MGAKLHCISEFQIPLLVIAELFLSGVRKPPAEKRAGPLCEMRLESLSWNSGMEHSVYD